MWAAGPAAWPPHSFLKLRAHSFDMLPPCLIFLDADGPANPLVACERCYVFPCRPCLSVGCERRSEISGKIMYHAPGDSNGCYKVTSLDVRPRRRPAKGSSTLYESTTWIPGLSLPTRQLYRSKHLRVRFRQTPQDPGIPLSALRRAVIHVRRIVGNSDTWQQRPMLRALFRIAGFTAICPKHGSI